MDKTLDYDDEASRQLEAMYVTDDVIAQRKAVLDALALGPGERVLDVGSGPGFLAADAALRIGSSGTVVGVDISESMVQMARQRCAHLEGVSFELGDAEDLEFPDASFDVVMSTQVLEYVPNPNAVLNQMHRVIRPGGRFGVLATDWSSLVWHSQDDHLMERVLGSWSQHCSDPHLPRTLESKLSNAGFEVASRSIVPILNTLTHRDTYSGGLIDLILGFVGKDENLRREELSSWATRLRELSDRNAYFFSLNRYLFVGSRPIE